MLGIRKADGIVEFVKTPEEFKREKLLEYLENLLRKRAEEGDEEARAIVEEMDSYVRWFSENVGS